MELLYCWDKKEKVPYHYYSENNYPKKKIPLTLLRLTNLCRDQPQKALGIMEMYSCQSLEVVEEGPLLEEVHKPS